MIIATYPLWLRDWDQLTLSDMHSLYAQSIQIIGAVDSRLISAKRSFAARLNILLVIDITCSSTTIR